MSIVRSAEGVSRPGPSQVVTASRGRARVAWIAAFAVAALGGVAPSHPARADEGAPSEAARGALVKLAEVASRVDASSTSLRNVTDLLKADAEAEIAAIDWPSAGVRKPYLVSASVVRLEARREDGALRATCTVSATIRDAKRGAIFAIVEGRARAEAGAPRPGGDDAAVRAERGALSGAVHGAVAAIPEAIRRAPD